MIRKEYIFLSLPVIVSVVIKPSIVPTLLYVSLLHTKDSPLSNNRLARNVVVLLQIISDIIIPLTRDAVGLNDYYYLAGDQNGIVYCEQVETIKVIFEDYELRFNEDSEYYYIQLQDKDGEYRKEDWTLENAILDMKRVLEES